MSHDSSHRDRISDRRSSRRERKSTAKIDRLADVITLRAGEVVGGRYRLESQIGEGGMASVWRALDQTLDRPVAIKFLYSGDPRRSDAMVSGFLREARIAAAVRHRNVVAILDFGTHENGIPFMVMELLEGETVEDRLCRSDHFSLEETIGIAVRVLQGLEEVHAAGIVHRDLKPGNIFLVRERSGTFPKLLDFGISRSLDPDSGRRSALTTKDGYIVGTLEYMSPEQARGVTDIDKRTDIYSMGVILYELITGQLPFESEHQGDLLVKIMTATPPSVAELAPEAGEPISRLVQRAMQRDREKRFPDAEQMQQALMQIAERALGNGAAKAMSVPPPAPHLSAARAGTIQMWTPEHKSAGPATTTEAFTVTEAPSAKPPPRTPADVDEPLQIPRRRLWSPFVAGTAAALLLGSAALTLAVAWPGSRNDKPAPRYIVVKGTSESKQPESAPAKVDNSTKDEPAGHTAQNKDRTASPDTARGEPGKTSSRRARRPRKRETAEARLARTFSEQKSGVEKCFLQHASELSGAPRLSLRLGLGTDGNVSKAEVFPLQVAGTPLGKCIEKACQNMSFGPQKDAFSFRIPLTARRGR